MVDEGQREQERQAIEAAYAAEIAQKFGVLCINLTLGESPKFDVALADLRRARGVALEAVNRKDRA